MAVIVSMANITIRQGLLISQHAVPFFHVFPNRSFSVVRRTNLPDACWRHRMDAEMSDAG